MRDEIREALLDLCFEHGVAAVSVAEVCRRAGITEAQFAARYGGIEDAFCDVYEAERDAVMAAVLTETEGIVGWRERLRAAAYALYRALDGDQRVTKFVSTEVRIAGERARRLQDEAIAELHDLLDQGREQAGSGASLSRGTAEAIGSAILGQIFVATAKGPMPPEGEVVPEMMYLALLPYLGREAAREELDQPPPPGPNSG